MDGRTHPQKTTKPPLGEKLLNPSLDGALDRGMNNQVTDSSSGNGDGRTHVLLGQGGKNLRREGR